MNKSLETVLEFGCMQNGAFGFSHILTFFLFLSNSAHVNEKQKAFDRIAYKNRQLYTASNTPRVQSTATAADST
jgi:hypothetical protein